ncbi:alkaline ceramidase 1 isoform X1 [Pyxicephalus adspersus]|uniref:alkaline ceramidase 1 isoform X1 n=1 Tax=Pyxicephalus adspersus TaxID=30357 RepID=UPI003B5936DF
MPPSIFARHSSEIDWCEANYLHSEYVAEYYNTVSNISFLLVGPLMMYLLHPYACRRTLMVHGVWILFIVIGMIVCVYVRVDIIIISWSNIFQPNNFTEILLFTFCVFTTLLRLNESLNNLFSTLGLFSIYYHMTLSFFGQLLDEISILWVICLGYSIWFPQTYFPRFIRSRGQFGLVVFIIAVISTLMSFVKPTVNAYVLNSITFHILYVLVKEIRKCTNQDIINLAIVSFCLWFVAISCWLSDRFLCNFWKRINFCYLHSFWHVFICLTVGHVNTVFAFFDAQYEIPECNLQVQYWPFKSTRFGLPYLAIAKKKNKKHC